MDRRTFTKTTLMGSLAAGMTWPGLPEDKTHLLTLSFDDGFKQSFYQIAEIYEDFGLSACLNVIASGHLPSFKAVDDWILPELMGDFDDWNSLKSRGHEVMPHSWQHLNLARQPLKKAQKLITRCLDYFEAHLEGYVAAEAVFNFPFNSSTPELEAFLLERVRAVRSGGESPINPIPRTPDPVRLSCWSHGPDNSDAWTEAQVNDFLEGEGGWLILNLHGLENEGWGPLSKDFLIRLLKRLTSIDRLALLPAGAVLKLYK